MEVDKCGQFPVLVEEDGLSSGRAINFRSIFVSASVYIYIYTGPSMYIHIIQDSISLCNRFSNYGFLAE